MFSKLKPLIKNNIKTGSKNPRIRRLNAALEKYKKISEPDTGELDEIILFRQAVADITPMIDDHAFLVRPKPKAKLLNCCDDEPLMPIFSEATEWLSLECPQQLSWVKHGYDPNLVKRLRTGKCMLDHRIDLHGLNIARASMTLQIVLKMMTDNQLRYLLIIHGKGNHLNSTGVLKAKVNEWLRSYSTVIAFASAPNKWGDTGATVVMLGVTS